MLTLERLRIAFNGFELTADLSIAPGVHVSIIGPSGAGKSSLLAAIAGFLEPAAGRVIWNGEEITSVEPGARPLTMLFQDQNLFPHLTVAQNVGLGLSPALRLSESDHRRVSESLIRVGLEGLDDRKPGALSGGQQSRVALARALLRDRPLLLLDEPFSALGPALKAEMVALVKEIASSTGATVLMVTHDPKDALALGGQTVLVADGVAHPPEPTEHLFNNPPPALRAYLE